MLSAIPSVNSIAVRTCKKDMQSSLIDLNISLVDFIGYYFLHSHLLVGFKIDICNILNVFNSDRPMFQ